MRLGIPRLASARGEAGRHLRFRDVEDVGDEVGQLAHGHPFWQIAHRENSMQVTFRRLTEAEIPAVAGFESEIAQISFPDDPVTDRDFYARKLKKSLWSKEEEPLVA